MKKPDPMKCAGTSKQTGQPCGHQAGWGTDHLGFGLCKFHGGNSPGGKKQAAGQRAEALTRTYGDPVDVSPDQALLDEVRYAAGHVAWLRAQVQLLEAGELVWGVTEEADKQATEFGGTDTTRRAAPNVWLDLYHRERRYLLDVSKAAISAGIEERLVRVAEANGAEIVSIINQVIVKLELSEDKLELAATVVPEVLRAMAQEMR